LRVSGSEVREGWDIRVPATPSDSVLNDTELEGVVGGDLIEYAIVVALVAFGATASIRK
jgi:hypothetical protein